MGLGHLRPVTSVPVHSPDTCRDGMALSLVLEPPPGTTTPSGGGSHANGSDGGGGNGGGGVGRGAASASHPQDASGEHKHGRKGVELEGTLQSVEWDGGGTGHWASGGGSRYTYSSKGGLLTTEQVRQGRGVSIEEDEEEDEEDDGIAIKVGGDE